MVWNGSSQVLPLLSSTFNLRKGRSKTSTCLSLTWNECSQSWQAQLMLFSIVNIFHMFTETMFCGEFLFTPVTFIFFDIFMNWGLMFFIIFFPAKCCCASEIQMSVQILMCRGGQKKLNVHGNNCKSLKN